MLISIWVCSQGTQPVTTNKAQFLFPDTHSPCVIVLSFQGLHVWTPHLLWALALITTFNLIFQNFSSADKSPKQSSVLTIQGSFQEKYTCPVNFPKERELGVQFYEPRCSSFPPLPILDLAKDTWFYPEHETASHTTASAPGSHHWEKTHCSFCSGRMRKVTLIEARLKLWNPLLI